MSREGGEEREGERERGEKEGERVPSLQRMRRKTEYSLGTAREERKRDMKNSADIQDCQLK